MNRKYSDITIRYTFSYFSFSKNCIVESSERIVLLTYWLDCGDSIEDYIFKHKVYLEKWLKSKNKILSSYVVSYISSVVNDNGICVSLFI